MGKWDEVKTGMGRIRDGGGGGVGGGEPQDQRVLWNLPPPPPPLPSPSPPPLPLPPPVRFGSPRLTQRQGCGWSATTDGGGVSTSATLLAVNYVA
ncbi:hypothetical protein M0802_010937 [Mischocyttarus mexicanus]|nr:hypothetical protein M0802_010937 [Mischocyttarus mexicanus]